MKAPHPMPGLPARKASALRGRWLLLALPYLGLCFPLVYARATPSLGGVPFFYWYQFVWVILTALILGWVYFKIKTPE